MKAVLLAAGLGTRLMPITRDIPKCLVEIAGMPILEIWVRHLSANGIDRILVNTHYFAEKVDGFLADLRNRTQGSLASVETVYEPELLGSAGTLAENLDFLADDGDVFVAYADTLTDFPVSRLIALHRNSDIDATIGVFRAPDPRAVGIVEVDGGNIMRSFIEKPLDPSGNLANAGLYVFRRSVVEEISDKRPADIGYDLLPGLVDRAQAVDVSDFILKDIGNPVALEQARAAWQERSQ